MIAPLKYGAVSCPLSVAVYCLSAETPVDSSENNTEDSFSLKYHVSL